jgi:hypothetical protein
MFSVHMSNVQCLNPFNAKKTDELVVTSNKLTNTFAGLVISFLGRMWAAVLLLNDAVVAN